MLISLVVVCGLVEELERFREDVEDQDKDQADWDEVHDQTGWSSMVKTATLALYTWFGIEISDSPSKMTR